MNFKKKVIYFIKLSCSIEDNFNFIIGELDQSKKFIKISHVVKYKFINFCMDKPDYHKLTLRVNEKSYKKLLV